MPAELENLKKLEQIIIPQRIVFEIIIVVSELLACDREKFCTLLVQQSWTVYIYFR